MESPDQNADFNYKHNRYSNNSRVLSLQTLCVKFLQRSILRRENNFAKDIHRCPIEVHKDLLSMCSAKQLKIAEKYSEKARIDLDTQPFWKELCRVEYCCERKSPDITWDIKYELLKEAKREAKKKAQERAAQPPTVSIVKSNSCAQDGAPRVKFVPGKVSTTTTGRKRPAGKLKIRVLPSGKVVKYMERR